MRERFLLRSYRSKEEKIARVDQYLPRNLFYPIEKYAVIMGTCPFFYFIEILRHGHRNGDQYGKE